MSRPRRILRRLTAVTVVTLIASLLSLSLPIPARSLDVALPEGVSDRRMAVEILWSGLKRLPVGQRPRVVLVLGGGGARGLAHIGVLRVLEQEKIPVDEIVGVSVGALIGALYASGRSVDEIETMAKQIGWNKLTDFSKVTLIKLILSDELLSSDKMEHYLKKQIGDKQFSDLNIPFSCIATDIRTGDRVIFREGPVAIAARASATIPAVFKPVAYGGRLLVDGGLVDNLPTDLAELQDGNTVVVASLPVAEQKPVDDMSVFRSLVRSIEIQKDVILRDKRRAADFLIEPDVKDAGLADLDRYPFLIEAGTIAARESAVELKELLIRRYMDKRSRERAAGQR